jgi:hypothetical protein
VLAALFVLLAYIVKKFGVDDDLLIENDAP